MLEPPLRHGPSFSGISYLKRIERERDIFKEALNSSVRRGLGQGEATPQPYRLNARRLQARPGVDLDKALRLAGELEDAKTMRKLRIGK